MDWQVPRSKLFASQARPSLVLPPSPTQCLQDCRCLVAFQTGEPLQCRFILPGILRRQGAIPPLMGCEPGFWVLSGALCGKQHQMESNLCPAQVSAHVPSLCTQGVPRSAAGCGSSRHVGDGTDGTQHRSQCSALLSKQTPVCSAKS